MAESQEFAYHSVDEVDQEEIYREGYLAGRMSDYDVMHPPYSGLEAEYWSDGFEDAREDMKQEEKGG